MESLDVLYAPLMLKGKDGDIYFESGSGVPCSVRALWERIEKLEKIVQNLSSSNSSSNSSLNNHEVMELLESTSNLIQEEEEEDVEEDV